MRAVADAFGARLVRHPSLEARVRGHFGEHTTEAHLKMAEAPDSEWGVSVGGSSITLTHTQPPRRAQRRLGVGVGWPHTTHPTHTHNYARQALRWRCLSIAWREARCRPSRSSAAATSTSCRVGGCRVLCVWGGVVAQRQGSQGGELAAEHVGRHTRTPTSPPPPPTHTHPHSLYTHHTTPPHPALQASPRCCRVSGLLWRRRWWGTPPRRRPSARACCASRWTTRPRRAQCLLPPFRSSFRSSFRVPVLPPLPCFAACPLST